MTQYVAELSRTLPGIMGAIILFSPGGGATEKESKSIGTRSYVWSR
jgi:hypothetical protein